MATDSQTEIIADIADGEILVKVGGKTRSKDRDY